MLYQSAQFECLGVSAGNVPKQVGPAIMVYLGADNSSNSMIGHGGEATD